MNIKRYYVPGRAVFITQVVEDREPVFRNPVYLVLLRQILHNVKQIHPFVMLGYAFLYDHFRQCSKRNDKIKVRLWWYEGSVLRLNEEASRHPETSPRLSVQQYGHRYGRDKQSFAFFDNADCRVRPHWR